MHSQRLERVVLENPQPIGYEPMVAIPDVQFARAMIIVHPSGVSIFRVIADEKEIRFEYRFRYAEEVISLFQLLYLL